ncbi:SGNH/GDSL hydrolase family protein [Neolewinella agarilytica]|uniref:SGNH/GDSL hydrolase family protein n=1 Tax=Neolewinella agarilytica TaxID=478744 RepID=UPI002354A823|nr:hypothetical protein [Neolewinella agarilytica]
MRKFLIRVVLFVLPLIAFLSAVELSERNNTFKAKSDWISRNENNIEVLILGSSQNWRDINPEYLSYETAPLAHGESAINMDFLVLEKYLNLFPNLKVVVFEIGYHNLEESKPSNWSKNHLFNIYYGVNNYGKAPSIKEYFLVTSNPKEYIKRFFTSDKNEKFGRYNSYGFVTESPNTLFEKLGYDSIKIELRAENYLMGRHVEEAIDIYHENVRKLKKAIRSCLEKDIAVVLLSPPKHYTYNMNMLEDKLQRRNLVFEYYSNIENVFIWNFEREYEFDSQYFGDPDHLNPKGAKIFTKSLDSLFLKVINPK